MIQILPKSGSYERGCQLKEYYVVGRKKTYEKYFLCSWECPAFYQNKKRTLGSWKLPSVSYCIFNKKAVYRITSFFIYIWICGGRDENNLSNTIIPELPFQRHNLIGLPNTAAKN